MTASPDGSPGPSSDRAHVEVWRVDLNHPVLDADAVTAAVPADEHASMRSMTEPHRGHRLLMRAVTRSVLSSYVDTAPSDVELVLGPTGRPAVAHQPWLCFSVSRRDGCGLLAVSAAPEPGAGGPVKVGVDVESATVTADGLAVARQFFDPVETRELGRLREAERGPAFLRYWTAKEAQAKATGRGIGEAGLVDVVLPASVRHGDVTVVSDRDGVPWTLVPLDVGSALVATLAVDRPADGFGWRLRDLEALPGRRAP